MVNVKNYGAVGDGEANDTKALQGAIDAAAEGGGGTVVVPAGKYVTGSLFLKSNINLHLEAGAVLLGSQNVEDFPLWRSEWEGPNAAVRRAPLIAGENLTNVSVTGRGVIDGRGEMWWKMQLEKRGMEVLRPLSYRLVNSYNLLVEGVTFKNSPMWTVSPLNCDNVTIRGITIINPPDSPNTDGINPESCRNVRIDSCHVDVGDDCITIKSGKETDGRRELTPCENITITNCTLLRGHGGVVIGSEMSGSVRNVVISNCVFVGTDRGLRFKSRRGRGGVIEDVRADNIVMDGVGCAFAVNLFYGCGAWGEDKVTDQKPWPVDGSTPRFRRFRFSNITAKNIKWAGIYIQGLPEMWVSDMGFDNVALYVDPENTEKGSPDMAPGMPETVGAGVIAHRVKGLVMRNVRLSHVRGTPVTVTDGESVVVEGLAVVEGRFEGEEVVRRNVR